MADVKDMGDKRKMKKIVKFFERLDEDIQFCIGLAGVQLLAVIFFIIPALLLRR